MTGKQQTIDIYCHCSSSRELLTFVPVYVQPLFLSAINARKPVSLISSDTDPRIIQLTMVKNPS